MTADELYNEGTSVLVPLDNARKQAELEVIILTNRLYNKMDEPSTLELYKNGRYFKWKQAVDETVNRLGVKERKLLEESFKNVYIKANPFNDPIDERLIERALDRDWAGRNFKDSIWNDTQLLKSQLRDRLQENISSGKGIDKLSNELRERFGVNKSRADTLARTETQYFINQGQADRYIERGVTEYEYDAEIDSKTSEVCDDLNGKVFSFAERQVGINFPPMHPNCRSTIKPMI